MPGRKILEFAKDLIAILFIKIKRLKTKRIKIGILHTALPGFLLGQSQNAATVSMPAQFLFHEQQFDVEPAPIGLSNQTASDLLIRGIQDEAYPFISAVACVLFVEIMDATADDSLHRLILLFHLFDAVFFTHGFFSFKIPGSS